LALLGRLPLPSTRRIAKLSVEFSGAMFVGQELGWRWEQPGDSLWRGSLSDGSRVLLSLTVWDVAGWKSSGVPRGGGPTGVREAAHRSDAAFVEPLAVCGRYGVETRAWEALCRAVGIAPDRVDPDVASVLLWSSWLVGMELPGRQALFQGFQCTFGLRSSAPGSPFDFEARTVRFDDRFALLRGCFELADDGTAWGSGEFRSFVRRPTDPASDPLLPSLLDADEPLAGRTALVIGASRGLGALTARALALSGATVYGSYLRSAEQFDRIRANAGAIGHRLMGLPGDGGDAQWCSNAVERICAECGALDFLVCNASPAILPMRYERESAVRIHEYVAYSLALASHPVATALPRLAESGGQVAVVSSVYAQSAPAQFPHYVAAKSAIEGLLRSVAAHHV
ncbi:MAG: SDR family oxidoreductase, partial [Armatimonadaceae bacterium]